MERLIIDTDPGVDDAQAILLAAAHPNAKIEALMTVGGNVGLEHTTRNALTLVEQIKQDIPVFEGCDGPLVMFQEDAAGFHGADGLGDCGIVPQKRTKMAEHASLAHVRLLNESPGAYTLVAIGPLTNIAVALKLDASLPHKVKRFVVMGGAVTAHGNTSNVSAEFNIFADPEAAHVVFEAWANAGQQVEVIDWEATLRHSIPEEVLNRWEHLDTDNARFFHKISARSLAFIRKYIGRTEMFGADPLALAVAVEPSCVQRAESHYLAVELNGRHSRGQTIVDWHDRMGKPANAKIILDVDQDRFNQMMEDGLG